jgi:guanine deaminase
MRRTVAKVFCDTLIRNGTTTACIYCAVYPQSVHALFEEALKRNLRLVAGKCMMDRNVPEPAGALWRETLQTHIAENRDEVAFATSLFPERKDFFDIYDHYGLVKTPHHARPLRVVLRLRVRPRA